MSSDGRFAAAPEEVDLPLFFLHVSDIHFAQVNPASLPHRTRQAWSRVPFLDRLLGHDPRTLARLDQFFEGVRGYGSWHLVQTGDVTGFGSVSEFQAGSRYFSSTLTPPYGDFWGLRLPDWKRRSVSGNHDRWPGNGWMFGTSNPWHGSPHFYTTPLVDRAIQAPSFPPIRFLGIDSEREVNPFGMRRLLAVGSFRDEVARLRRALDHRRAREIHILMMHHSRLAADCRTNGIERVSREMLDRLVGDYDIRVVLTGHVHAPRIEEIPVGDGAHRLLETRCGTTAQKLNRPVRTYLELSWMPDAAQRVARNARKSQSLLVHRLAAENGSLVWRSQAFRLSRHGFRPTGITGARVLWP